MSEHLPLNAAPFLQRLPTHATPNEGHGPREAQYSLLRFRDGSVKRDSLQEEVSDELSVEENLQRMFTKFHLVYGVSAVIAEMEGGEIWWQRNLSDKQVLRQNNGVCVHSVGSSLTFSKKYKFKATLQFIERSCSSCNEVNLQWEYEEIGGSVWTNQSVAIVHSSIAEGQDFTPTAQSLESMAEFDRWMMRDNEKTALVW